MVVKTEMTIGELTELATEFLRVNYEMELAIPIKRNNRLTRAMGRYAETWKGAPLQIEIAGKALDYGADEFICGILRHELIHYALHVKGEPNDDGHPHFEEELRKHDAPVAVGRVGVYYRYKCRNCEEEAQTKTKRVSTHPTEYRTTCCATPLDYVGERVYDGMEAIT